MIGELLWRFVEVFLLENHFYHIVIKLPPASELLFEKRTSLTGDDSFL